MRKASLVFLFGLLLFLELSRVAKAEEGRGELQVLSRANFEQVLRAKGIKVISEVGNIGNVPQVYQEEFARREEQHIPSPKEANIKALKVDLAHLVWLKQDREVFMYLETALPFSTRDTLVVARMGNDGKPVVDPGIHSHGTRFYEAAILTKIRVPIPMDQLANIFNLSEEDLEVLVKGPPPSISAATTTTAILPSTSLLGLCLSLVFGFWRVRNYRRRQEFQPIKVYRAPVVNAPRRRRRRNSLPPGSGRNLPPPPTPEEIAAECDLSMAKLQEGVEKLSGDDRTTMDRIVRKLEEIQSPARRLRMIQYFLVGTAENQTLTSLDEQFVHEDSSNPQSEFPSPLPNHAPDLPSLLAIDDFLPEDVDRDCAKAIIIDLLRPGRQDPYIGSRKVADADLLRRLESSHFSRELGKKTIQRLLRMGVLISGNVHFTTDGERYSLAPHAKEVNGPGGEILHQALTLRRMVITRQIA